MNSQMRREAPFVRDANLGQADLRTASFTRTNPAGAHIPGADFTNERDLAQTQIDQTGLAALGTCSPERIEKIF